MENCGICNDRKATNVCSKCGKPYCEHDGNRDTCSMCLRQSPLVLCATY
ncbi:MAG: hypothetical protein AMQ74_01687 [Candidatus Methanofastidiosum methylothiophilum]|uniref:Uncharacterized protein n=1 Tax=Candidatus Methanofastidiosum methylothiophilum TaxID=1705564 RepID=A0A150IR71_9EURY|nr:MAG: hypothetical protein AMQ74_01687 [Candidatus Methanofastidiosum methylthiophilus]